MLIASSLSGIWAGVPLAWEQSDRLDETRYAADIERCLALGRQESTQGRLQFRYERVA